MLGKHFATEPHIPSSLSFFKYVTYNPSGKKGGIINNKEIHIVLNE
jgi:hypothetical protein